MQGSNMHDIQSQEVIKRDQKSWLDLGFELDRAIQFYRLLSFVPLDSFSSTLSEDSLIKNDDHKTWHGRSSNFLHFSAVKYRRTTILEVQEKYADSIDENRIQNL